MDELDESGIAGRPEGPNWGEIMEKIFCQGSIKSSVYQPFHEVSDRSLIPQTPII